MERRILAVEREGAGTRLDRWLAAAVPEQSRAKLQALIEAGHVLVDGAAARASHRLRGGERISIDIPPPAPETLEPEAIALTVVHEDDDVLVLDKPAGMVVHPGPATRGAPWRRRSWPMRPAWRGWAARAGPASCIGSTRTPPACS